MLARLSCQSIVSILQTQGVRGFLHLSTCVYHFSHLFICAYALDLSTDVTCASFAAEEDLVGLGQLQDMKEEMQRKEVIAEDYLMREQV